MKTKFDVTGMTCSACSAHVENAVKKVNGVTSASVSLLTNSMNVEYLPDVADTQTIINAVQSAGYGASVSGEAVRTQKGTDNAKKSNAMLTRMLFSVGFCVVLMYFSMGHMVGLPLPPFLSGHQNAVSLALVQLLLCFPVWILNKDYFVVGFKRLFKGSPNMDSLIAVGSTASGVYAIVVTFVMSYALGNGDMDTVMAYHHKLYFESSAMILALVDLGKYFETRSKVKTGDALAKLRQLAPAKALLVLGGETREVDSKQIALGNVVAVKAGMSFPCDGVVISGSCFADESAISGESIPVEKQVGNNVIGGTVNAGGYVEVSVTSVGEDSVLSKIINLVEEAGSSKAPIQRLADKISAVFTPIVMAISLVTLVVWLCVGESVGTALDFAVSVLVISCPCALGLATPVAIMVATGKGAENGILIKNGEILESLSKIKQVVLDKTGTITLGKPQVKTFQTSLSKERFFAVVGGIEKQSEHPLGKAIVAYAETNGIQTVAPQDFQTLAGLGVVATVDGEKWAIGNKRLMEKCGVKQDWSVLDKFYNQAYTCLIVARDSEYVGTVCVGDEVKPSSAAAIAELKKAGVRTIMLTGDNALSANAIAKAVGIDEVYADVLPQEKQQKVAELMRSGFTAMVGDGINDAPALTQADIGFAIGSGSDIAVDSADVILLKNDLSDVPTAISLSKKTIRNIKQNLFWAFFYNALGIPVAAGVLYATPLHLQLSPMNAAAAMSLSSLFVVTNALRLKFFKPVGTVHSAQTSEQLSNGCVNDVCDVKSEVNNMKTITLSVEGMMCGHCQATVEKALKGVPGVSEVVVSLEDKNAVVTAEESVSADALKAAVVDAGYEVTNIQ